MLVYVLSGGSLWYARLSVRARAVRPNTHLRMQASGGRPRSAGVAVALFFGTAVAGLDPHERAVAAWKPAGSPSHRRPADGRNGDMAAEIRGPAAKDSRPESRTLTERAFIVPYCA